MYWEWIILPKFKFLFFFVIRLYTTQYTTVFHFGVEFDLFIYIVIKYSAVFSYIIFSV
jgi:hypothetical protein